ncbi:hypothetical protein OQM05_004765 [Salmonella enterica]|nr:hypothetical protein [Salmonella enterica]EGC4778484.1 hypothetical protein [Salmonella enterica]EKC9763188.1 hypothetical protein [Salmonella enterica]
MTHPVNSSANVDVVVTNTKLVIKPVIQEATPHATIYVSIHEDMRGTINGFR